MSDWGNAKRRKALRTRELPVPRPSPLKQCRPSRVFPSSEISAHAEAAHCTNPFHPPRTHPLERRAFPPPRGAVRSETGLQEAGGASAACRARGAGRRAEGQALPAPRPTPAPRPSSQPHPARGRHAQSAGASRAGLWDPGRGSGRPRLIIRSRWSRSARPIRRPWPRTAAGPRRGHTPPSRSLPSCGPRPGAGWLASRGGLNKGLCGASPARRGLGSQARDGVPRGPSG